MSRAGVLLAPWVSVLVILTGCIPAEDSPSTPDHEEIYLEALKSEAIELESSDALSIGYGICDDLAAGAPVAEVLGKVYAAGFSYHDAGFIYGAAVAALCPGQLE